MTATPRLSLPLLAAGQAQKHVTHNDALVRLDGLIHLAVASRTETTPPSSTEESDAYIVPPEATGAFAGRTDQLALYEDAGWTFLTPRIGWQAWVSDEAELQVWTGTEWRRAAPTSSMGAELWGVNGTADETTRLVVAAEASLFNHDGEGHQLKLNKAGEGDTASLLYQTGYSGRAELGLAGDDDLHVKVSADGTGWTEAIVIDRTTGAVTLPATRWAHERPQPNLLINGNMQVNQRGFAGGTLAAGSYGFDRWKAGASGATLSVSGFTITLSAGAIIQAIEPALWGLVLFASVPLCLSVEGLTDGDLTVTIGSQSGTITAGGGRRAVNLTPASGDSGTLAVQLAPASAAVSFSRIKLEFGTAETGWAARPLSEEEQLCRRYYFARSGALLVEGYQAAGGKFRQDIALPCRMRATPTVSFTSSLETNIETGSDPVVEALSAETAYAEIVAEALGRVSATFNEIIFDAEL